MFSTLPILVILSKEDSCKIISIISQRFGVSVDNLKPWDKFPQAPYVNCGFKAYHNSTLIVEVAMTNYFPLSFKLFPQIIETIPKHWFLGITRRALYLSVLPFELCLVLKTHLQPMVLKPSDNSTKYQTSLSPIDFYVFVASTFSRIVTFHGFLNEIGSSSMFKPHSLSIATT